MTELLRVKDLHASVEDKEILHGVDLTIRQGETHVLMGPNGAGKSTLGYTIMGDPRYEVGEGEILFKGEDITDKAADKRAGAGLYLTFQTPVEVPGITLGNFIRSAMEQRGEHIKLWDFIKKLNAAMDTLHMDRKYSERDLNVGFSGGEMKKAEILQLLMLNPSLAILDETDSGLDVDAVHTVSEGVREFQKNEDASLLIITHSTRILESLDVDVTHVLVDGRIVAEGGPELVDEINEHGFERFLESAGAGEEADGASAEI